MSLPYHPSSQFDPHLEMDDPFAKTTISGIKSEITKLDADLDHTSPIKCLPNEILAEIFVQALHSLHPPFPDVDNPTFGEAALAPIRQMRGSILRVCWQWRRTTISEPRLWQVVKLTIGSPSGSLKAEACQWQHIQERIAWAGSLKFHLVVYHMKSSASINDDQAFKILCRLLPRLLSLHVRLEKGMTITPIRLNDPPAMYSNLKQICVEASRYPETRGWCENLLSNTPEVVCLALPSPENMSFLPNVLSNLRFLSLGRAEPDDVVTILDCVGRLLSLHVKSFPYGHDRAPSSGKTGIIQSQLSRLRIDDGEISFLSRLTLPALRHLAFQTAGLWPTSTTHHFFDRSQCKLVTLEAQTSDIDVDSSVSRIMQAQETITTLRLSSQYSIGTGSAVPDEFLLSLADTLPKLAVCHFMIHYSQLDILRAALYARLEAQKAGKVVRMDDWVVTYSSPRRSRVLDGIIDQLWNSGSNLGLRRNDDFFGR